MNIAPSSTTPPFDEIRSRAYRKRAFEAPLRKQSPVVGDLSRHRPNARRKLCFGPTTFVDEYETLPEILPTYWAPVKFSRSGFLYVRNLPPRRLVFEAPEQSSFLIQHDYSLPPLPSLR